MRLEEMLSNSYNQLTTTATELGNIELTSGHLLYQIVPNDIRQKVAHMATMGDIDGAVTTLVRTCKLDHTTDANVIEQIESILNK